jgi:hypothetical protein
MTLRRQLRDVLVAPRTASSIARELGLKRGDVEEDLRHAIRSARAAGEQVQIEPVPQHPHLRAARLHSR